MPVISVVGRRSWGARVLILALYLMLAVGSVSMIYPFLLMLSTSITSSVDLDAYQVVPEYLYDDEVLLAKYAEDKYVFPTNLDAAYGCEIFHFRELVSLIRKQRAAQAAQPPAALRTRLKDWREFVAALPREFKTVVFLSPPGMSGRGETRYRDFVERKFKGVLEACKQAYEEDVPRFQALSIPYERLSARDYLPELDPKYQHFLEFKDSLPEKWLSVVGLDWKYAAFLRGRYEGDLARLNADLGTDYRGFLDAHLSEEPPAQGKEREAWVEFMVEQMPIPFAAVANGRARFQEYLDGVRRQAGLAPVILPAEAWDTEVRPGFDRPRMLGLAPVAPHFFGFLRVQRPEQLRALTVENLYRGFLVKRYGAAAQANAAYALSCRDWRDFTAPALEADRDELQPQRSECRWYYVRRNYGDVIDYILLHGNAVWNTIVLVALSLLTQLTFNPMAAYGLSRFNLSYGNKVLLFCLATMAFPPEVDMIPSFLLLRSFPLAQLVVGTVMGALTFGIYLLLMRGGASGSRSPSGRKRLLPGILIACALGFAAAWGIPGGKVSLLNSYWALVLPAVANGFSIFLLKGFFDTLPRELYEAAAMEGAGELLMFRRITLPMCAPVLAVIGLSTFTATFGSFMWAFLVCQREDMWTLMVWLYEMQQWAPKYMLTAALTLAAIPTLIAFILCQRFILRGIVLPTMH